VPNVHTICSTLAQIGTNVRHQFWSSQLAEHRDVVRLSPANTGIHLLGVLLAALVVGQQRPEKIARRCTERHGVRRAIFRALAR
jgi:hypothetical protein